MYGPVVVRLPAEHVWSRIVESSAVEGNGDNPVRCSTYPDIRGDTSPALPVDPAKVGTAPT